MVVGAGGFAREVLDVIEAINSLDDQWAILGLVADPPPGAEHAQRCRHAYLGGVDVLTDLDCQVVIGIGNGTVRRRLDEQITAMGREAATFVHPSVTMGAKVELGSGTVLCAGVRITTNVTLGRHCHINLNSTVGHDARLGDYVTVNPLVAVSGNASLGTETTVGTGAAILEGRRTGERCTVGAGAVLTKDCGDDQTLVGIPARPLAPAR